LLSLDINFYFIRSGRFFELFVSAGAFFRTLEVFMLDVDNLDAEMIEVDGSTITLGEYIDRYADVDVSEYDEIVLLNLLT